MNAFKQQCIELRRRDHTLPEIVRMTGRSKTSVYFHIKGIPLSVDRQNAIRVASGQRVAHAASSRKGKSTRPFRVFDAWDCERTLLVAHLLFDGELSRSSCVYHSRSKSLRRRFERLMSSIYEFPPRPHMNSRTGVGKISYHNVALAQYLRQKAEQLKQEIPHLPRECRREFLRAFFDDEGCMDFRPQSNKRCVRGYQKNRSILELVQRLLSQFGIDASLRGKNEVVISGKENLRRFQEEINFSTGVRINGKRSNSIWKRSLEKRELLARAIASYKT